MRISIAGTHPINAASIQFESIGEVNHGTV